MFFEQANIIMATFGAREAARDALGSLFAHEAGSPFRLRVYDSPISEKDGTRELLRDYADRAEIEFGEHNLAHWQALDQCEKTLSRLLPNVERVQVYDTAGAVKMVLEEQRRDTAAIASKRAAELYGLPILREALEDDPTNFTRFVALSREPVSPPAATPCKTSLVFATRNIPGALYKALAAFALREIDLTKIESRPLQGSPWEYLFYLDFAGNQSDEICGHALAQLREFSTFVRVLGSYPRANMPA